MCGAEKAYLNKFTKLMHIYVLKASGYFKFLSDIEVKYPDLPNPTAVWWLSIQ